MPKPKQLRPRPPIKQAATPGTHTSRKALKASKPPPGVLVAVENLRDFVEDHWRWVIAEVACHEQLEKLLNNLRKLQRDTKHYRALVPKRTKETFDTFVAWLKELGYDTENMPFRIDFAPGDPGDNATLYATRDIAKDEVFASVSGDFIMVPDLSPSSPLGKLIAAVPTLGDMPSITLALCLLLEAADPNSKYAPYIASLPASFTIPFGNFSPADVAGLRPSPAAAAALKSLRAQVRNYAYIYMALHRLKLPDFPVSVLSWENFVWAVSIAMTRQNAIPIKDPPPLGLVPVWDMCNHTPGENKTEILVTEEGDLIVQSSAMRDFMDGEAITMSYGERPNVQLLQYSGFVQPDNEHDFFPMYLHLPAGAELAVFKAKFVLSKLEVPVKELEAGRGWIIPMHIAAGEESGKRILSVARIVEADKQAINAILKDGAGLPTEPLENEAQEQAAQELVRKTIQNSLAEYEEAYAKYETLSPLAQVLAAQLHAEEKKLLLNTLASVSDA